MSKKEQLKIVYEYLSHLDDVLKELVRRQEVQVSTFSFSRLETQVREIESADNNPSLSAEEKEYQKNKNKNALNVFNAAAAISSAVKLFVENNRKQKFTKDLLEPSAPRRFQDPCAYPEFVERVYPIVKEAAYPSVDAHFPIKWETFISNYLSSPTPYYKILQNPYKSSSLSKLKLTISEYAEQKDFFDKVKQPDKYDGKTTRQILDWYGHNKGSWFASGEQWYTKENITNIKRKLLGAESLIERYRLLYNLVYDRVCINSMFSKAMECTLPPLECFSLIKLLGPANVLAILAQLQQVDPRVTEVEELFNARPEDQRTEENFFNDIEQVFGDDIEYLCQFVIYTIFKSLGIKAPSIFDLIPGDQRSRITDPFQGFMEQLISTLVDISVNFSTSLIIELMDLLSDCDNIEKLLSGDLSGTDFENIGASAGDLISDSFKELGQDVGSFLLGMKEKVNRTQLGQNAAATSGNRTLGWSAFGDWSIPTLNQGATDTSPGVDSLFGGSGSSDLSGQDPRFEQIASIISGDNFFNNLVELIGMAKTIRMLSGDADDSTMESVRGEFFSDLEEEVSLDYLLEIFSIIGVFYGLSNLKDEFLGAATSLEELNIPLTSGLKCNVTLEDMDPAKADKVRSILDKITNSDFLSDLADPSGNSVTSAFDTVPVPRVVADSIRIAVKGSILPIKMSYDNDMRLYKAASSEEIMATRKVPKILWSGETIRNNVFEDGKVVSRSGKIKDTIINPEFEGMIANGHIPLKTDGKTDGTKFGALLKTKWWPPWDEDWLTKKERITLGRDENGDPIDDADVADLPGALGPFTDYDEENGGSAYAFKQERQVRQASGTRKALGLIPVNLSDSFLGDEIDLDNPENLSEALFENYFVGRGERRVYSEETIEELDRLYEEFNTVQNRIQILESMMSNDGNTPSPPNREQYPSKTDDRFYDKAYDPGFGNSTPLPTFYKKQGLETVVDKQEWIVEEVLSNPDKVMKRNYLYKMLLDGNRFYYDLYRLFRPNSTLTKDQIREQTIDGTIFPPSLLHWDIITQYSNRPHLKKYLLKEIDVQDPLTFTNLGGAKTSFRPSERGATNFPPKSWLFVFNEEKYNAEKAAIDERYEQSLSEYNEILEQYNENVVEYAQSLLSKRLELGGRINQIKQQAGDLEVFENYNEKTYYGFSGKTNKSVISENQNVQKFMGDDNRVVETEPSYRISIANEYGFNLDNDTYFFVYRDGRKPMRTSVRRTNSYSLDTINALTPNIGPYPGKETTPVGPDGQPCEPDPTVPPHLEALTSQERVFHHLISEFYSDTLSSSELEEVHKLLVKQEDFGAWDGNDYDNIYENVFHVFLSKMRSSELLKEVDVLSLFQESIASSDSGEQSLSTYNGEAPIGMSFINFNPTNSKNYELISKDPRIMDFDNITEQVISNYNLFVSKNLGEENPDGLQNYETNLQLALRTAHPVLVARVYLLEYMLQSVVPTMSMGFTLNEMTQKTILSRIQLDMSERTPYLKRFKENTINCFKLLRDNNLINTDLQGEPLFSQAFGFFLKREAPFILKNLRKIVFKEQVSCAPDSSAGLGLSGDNNLVDDSKNRMREAFLDSIPMTVFNRRNFQESPSGPSFDLINSSGRFFDSNSSNEKLYKNMENVLSDSEEGTLLLQINSDPYEYFGSSSFIAAYLNGDDSALRTQYERIRDFQEQFGVDMGFDSFEEWLNDKFATTTVHTRLLYVKKDLPFDVDSSAFKEPSGEKFFYFSDNGTINGENKWRCYELASAKGTYQEILGQSLSEFAKICEEQLEEQYNVTGQTSYDILENAVVKKLLIKLRDSDKFDVMFDYCFNLGDISSVAVSHISQSNMTDDMLRMFNSTKEKIRMYLNNLNTFGTNLTIDNSDCLPKAANTPGIGNFNEDIDFSSEILLLMLSTPLYIYKGWVKVADPHCLITQTIVDLAETGFLIPKMKEFKVPDLNLPPPDNCTTITLPAFPGDPISFFGLTQAVALGVTFAPVIVGAPPFPPTPFGLIYYTVVEPLLYLLEMDWRNEKMMENLDYKNAIVVQTGIDMEDIPVCIEDQDLLDAARIQEAQDIEDASDNLDEDSSCPTLDIEFYKGDNC